MPKRRKYLFNDPQFNAFVYHWFATVNDEDLKTFTPEELRKVRVGKSLRRWSTDGVLEEKLILLAKSGCPFMINFGNKERLKEVEKDLREKPETPTSKIAHTMAKHKLFSLSSNAVLLSQYFLHQNSQSDFYLLNRDFQKIYSLWVMAGKNLGNWRTAEDLKEVSYGFNATLEVAFKTMRYQSIYTAVGLRSEIDLMILLYLSRKWAMLDYRNSFHDPKKIYAECSDGSKKLNSYTRRLSFLVTKGYVYRNNKNAYCIADRGVMVVGDYLKKIVELASLF